MAHICSQIQKKLRNFWTESFVLCLQVGCFIIWFFFGAFTILGVANFVVLLAFWWKNKKKFLNVKKFFQELLYFRHIVNLVIFIRTGRPHPFSDLKKSSQRSTFFRKVVKNRWFLGTFLGLNIGQNVSKFCYNIWKTFRKNWKIFLVENLTIILSFTCVKLTNNFFEKFADFGAWKVHKFNFQSKNSSQMRILYNFVP